MLPRDQSWQLPSGSIRTRRRGAEAFEWTLAEAAEREVAWERRLNVLARADGIDLGALPERNSAAPKALLAAAMKQSTSVSNGWLAEHLQMGQPASASQFVRRLLLNKREKREVEGLLSRVKT